MTTHRYFEMKVSKSVLSVWDENVNLGIKVDLEKYLMLLEKRGNLARFLFCFSSIVQGHYLLISRHNAVMNDSIRCLKLTIA